MLFELLGFLLSTNVKVKKMTTVSAVMFEIVEKYIFQIHLHYFFLACRDIFSQISRQWWKSWKKRRIGKKNIPLSSTNQKTAF
jgi:hypothetical protein